MAETLIDGVIVIVVQDSCSIRIKERGFFVRKLNCLPLLESCFRTLRQVVPVAAAVLIGFLAAGSAHAQLTGTFAVLTSETPQIVFNDDVAPTRSWTFLGTFDDFRFQDNTAATIPFLISGGAPTGSLRIDAVGRVGLGAFNPDPNTKLTVQSAGLINGFLLKRTDASSHYARVENPAGAFRLGVQSNGDAQLGALTANKQLTLLAGGSSKMVINASGQFSFGNPPPTIVADALTTSTGAVLTIGGVWMNASSRALKQDIEPITSEQARDTVRGLQPVGYRYKSELDEHYVGFIAEDVPELVATRNRKGLAPMDIVGVLTKVVQDQDQKLDQQRQELDQQRQLNAELFERLLKLEQKLGDTTEVKPTK